MVAQKAQLARDAMRAIAVRCGFSMSIHKTGSAFAQNNKRNRLTSKELFKHNANSFLRRFVTVAET